MLKEELYLEDLVLHLAGIAPVSKDLDPPKLESSDINLIQSFGSQIVRNLGFTDRQYDLAKRKIDDYKNTFSFIVNLEEVKERTRIPLRQIDRSRWIRIEENSKGDYEIAVRFTFQKKLISSINEIRRSLNDKGSYDKETKIHRFEYSERNLWEIVTAFKDKNFDLSDEVQDIYKKIDAFDPDNYIPGVYKNEIKNLHPNGVKAITSELGNPTSDNLILFKDRSLKYGINVPTDTEENSLTIKIAKRQSTQLQINNTDYAIDNILVSLNDLERLPILILVPFESCYDSIVEIQDYVQNLVPSKDVSVMFRLDNQGDGLHFNEYIKSKGINNKLDKNTKIVYTLDNKIPKPLLTSDWNPNTILVYGNSRVPSTRKVLECYNDKDLIIHYHDGAIPTHFFYNKNIELIK